MEQGPHCKANEPVSKRKLIGKIEDKWEEEGKKVTWAALMATTNVIALKLEDQDDDSDSGIAGHQEKVYVDLECSDT